MATDIIVLTKHVEDIAQWPVYLTIGNLNYEIRRSRLRPGGMIVGLISIHKEDFLKDKMEIYDQTMRIIIIGIFKSLFLYIVVKPGITLEKALIEGLLMMCVDGCV